MVKILIFSITLILLFALMYFDNTSIKVHKHKIKSNKISHVFNNFKIVHLSDFHSYGSKNYKDKLIRKINNENPDIIVMTGDMVNKYDTNFEKFFYLAEALSKNYEIYYIIGNHEQRLKEEDLSLIIKKLNQLGIKVLRDEKAVIKRKEQFINIYGMEIPLSFYRRKKETINIENLITGMLNQCNEEEYNILLTHNPLYFEFYAKHNVDLIFSGHVHGGMIRLPFIGALLSPERKFFPKYSSGIYKYNNNKLIVSRGLGHSKFGIRVFNSPEIVSIILEKE